MGEIEDFAIDYLNPAAQRMSGLAERPGGTLLTCFPHATVAGILGYYRRVYLAGATTVHEVNYQADGLDNYFRLAARRSGDLLVVSFTDTSDQDRSTVEQALRQSQARVQAARAAAEHQRNELRDLVAQVPVAVAVYQGPQHRVAVANAATLAIWDRAWANVRDRPVFEVLPAHCQPLTSGCSALIFLDLNMPVMDGFAFLEAYQLLPAAQRQGVVLMLTTSVNPRDLARLQDLPVAGFLAKPLTEEKIARVLADHFPPGSAAQ